MRLKQIDNQGLACLADKHQFWERNFFLSPLLSCWQPADFKGMDILDIYKWWGED